MRCCFKLMALGAFCISFTAANQVQASHGGGNHGGGSHSGSNHSSGSHESHSSEHSHSSNHENKPKHSHSDQVVTGNRGGTSFIADPAHRNVKSKHGSSDVTKIVDPIRPPHGGSTLTTTTDGANLIGIPQQPTRVTPVVRDHSVPKTPPVNPNPYANPPTVTGGSGLHFTNPFSFTAPPQPGVRDHRTQGYPGGNGTDGHPRPDYTPDTHGPANTYPTQGGPRGGGK